MKKKTIIYLVVFAVLIAGVIIFLKRPAKAPKTSYLTAKVTRGDLNVTVTSTGTLNPDSNIAVGTQVSGILSKIYVDYNYTVKKNQMLALIDTTPLKEAENDSRAALAKARANVFQTQKAFERTKVLLQGKAAAQADYDVAEANYKSAQADQLSAQAELDKAITNFKYAFIKAPISGTVVSRNVDIGQTVAASFSTPTLFMIANDLTKMQVQAAVDETDIGQVVLGQEVFFSVDAYPNRKFYGKVSQIRLQPTVTNNVVNYTVIVEVPNPDLKLMPGMTANITFEVESHKNVILIPSKALTFNPPGYSKPKRADSASKSKKIDSLGHYNTPGQKKSGHVWILKGDSISMVKVELGISNGLQTEVVSGLNEDEAVITEISTAANPDAQAAKSPFAPSFGGKGSGGGKRQ